MMGNIDCAPALCSGRTVLSRKSGLRYLLSVAAALACAACTLLVSPPPPKPTPRLDEPTIRKFIAEQETAWNARDFDHYYSLCAPEAVFVSVHWNADGTITRDQRTAADDRASAQRFFANHPGKVTEIDSIDSIKTAPDGLSARILGHGSIRFLANGKPQVLNAITDQTVILRDGHVLSLGQTDVSER